MLVLTTIAPVNTEVQLAIINPFPNNKFWTLPNSQSLQTTIFNLMKMAKFFKWVENTVGKGEIARFEQFLLYPQCFQKTYPADT